MHLTLAILWTFSIILHILQMQAGQAPTWSSVFIPLVTLAAVNWIDAIFDYLNRH